MSSTTTTNHTPHNRHPQPQGPTTLNPIPPRHHLISTHEPSFLALEGGGKGCVMGWGLDSTKFGKGGVKEEVASVMVVLKLEFRKRGYARQWPALYGWDDEAEESGDLEGGKEKEEREKKESCSWSSMGMMEAGEDASATIKSTEDNKRSTAEMEAEVQEKRAALHAKLELVGVYVFDDDDDCNCFDSYMFVDPSCTNLEVDHVRDVIFMDSEFIADTLLGDSMTSFMGNAKVRTIVSDTLVGFSLTKIYENPTFEELIGVVMMRENPLFDYMVYEVRSEREDVIDGEKGTREDCFNENVVFNDSWKRESIHIFDDSLEVKWDDDIVGVGGVILGDICCVVGVLILLLVVEFCVVD
ncbi:hypothetical protein KSS87_004386 [Heliosperma pusillum]|nr:hypothetical protein KSS87_004386 [Heliosperma pusillum]